MNWYHNKERKIYFKKTILGHVLMIQERKPGTVPGSWKKSFHRKATEKEVQSFVADLSEFETLLKLKKWFRKEHPEMFI